MRLVARLFVLYASSGTVDAFTGHSRPSLASPLPIGTTSTTLAQARGFFVPNLPNPFADLQQSDINPFGKGFQDDKRFDPSPEGLVRQAKKVLSAELGLMDPSLLDDDEFEWIGPYVDRPLDKTDYLAAGRFFSVTTAFPDLNFRAHDFRVDDDEDAAVVRMTCRTTGTMRGELRLRDEILPPTGNIMSCPPEAVSIKFNLETGKVVRICSGFCMDRVVGNTDGTTGVVAAAITGGKPISDWEVYPPLTVLQRIFGRPEAPIEEAKNFLAPFPETVMIQLAKGILTSNMAVEDPSLLSEDFVFSTPSAGPIGKREFLANYAPEEFNGVQPKFRNYRVDPYDPNRVWVDVMPKGPGYVGSPQAMSFAFDADGFCTRITSWYVLDPTVGNGGGLGGPEGFKFAQGSANEFAARPLPRILGRVKNSFLDLLRSDGKKKVPVPVIMPPTQPPPKKAAIPKPSSPVQRLATSITPASAPASSERERLPIPLQKLTKSFGTINLLEMQREAGTQRKQREPVKKKASPATKTTGVTSSFKDQLAKQKEALTAQAKALQAKQKEMNTVAKQQEKSAQKRKQQEAVAAAEQKGKQQKEAAAALAQKRKQQQKEAAQKKQAAAAAQKRQQQEAVEQKRKQQKELTAQKGAEQKVRRESQANAQANRRAAEQKLREDAARKAADAEAKRIAKEQARQEQELAKKMAAEKKQRELEERKQADLEKKQKLAQEKALKEQRLAQQREMERQKNERIVAEKCKQEERVRIAKQAKKEETALKALSKTPVASTFRLFGLVGSDDDEDDSDMKGAPVRKQTGAKKAPRGVPMLSRWRKNLDGSVSGLVSGSRSFTDGERVTTSPIKSGSLSSGEVVVTGSGSKYFLE